VALVLLQNVLLLVVIGLIAAAFLIDRSGLRGRDYLRFESRAVLSQRLILAALALMIVVVLIGIPLVGAVLLLIAIVWTLWWLPASHRHFDLGVEAVFEAPPEAVAAVMFDISQQPRWMDSVVAAVLETPGLLRAGSVIRQTIRLSGHDLTARLAVTAFVPYERLELTVQVRHGRPSDLFAVAPHDRGSLVRSSGRHDLSRVNAILSGWRLPTLRKGFTERRAANLERLRALVMSRPLERNSPRDVPAG
jgi:hypothetical protein